LEIDFDIVIGQKGGELDKLVSKIFNELIINVGDPSLEFDGNVLKKKMYGLLFLQDRLYLYHMLVF
jgi:hypothetical protein